jgi:hypothetical protein
MDSYHPSFFFVDPTKISLLMSTDYFIELFTPLHVLIHLLVMLMFKDNV